MRLHHRPLFLALLVLGYAPVDPPPAQPAGEGAPSAHDLHVAMASSLPADVGCMTAEWVCPTLTQHQCSPTRNGQRFHYTYRDGRGRRGTAVVERQEEGRWRWIRGSRRCGALL